MSPETRDLITWWLGTTLAMAALVGLIGKWIVLPWLRENLIKPTAQIKDQVKNDHSSNLRDDLDGAREDLDGLRTDVRSLSDQLRVIGDKYEGHLEWSSRWVALMEREVDDLRQCVHRDDDK